MKTIVVANCELKRKIKRMASRPESEATQVLQEKNCPRRKETSGISSEPHCPKVRLLHSKKERSVTEPRQGFPR
jgi:hypothetical protein